MAQEVGAGLGQCEVLFRSVQAIWAKRMKLDFWQYTHDPLEKVVALIAKRALGEGEQLVGPCLLFDLFADEPVKQDGRWVILHLQRGFNLLNIFV